MLFDLYQRRQKPIVPTVNFGMCGRFRRQYIYVADTLHLPPALMRVLCSARW